MTTKHIVFMILKAVLWKKEKIVAGKWTWKVVVWGNEEEGQGWGELIEVSQHQTWQSLRCWWHATVKWFWNCVFYRNNVVLRAFTSGLGPQTAWFWSCPVGKCQENKSIQTVTTFFFIIQRFTDAEWILSWTSTYLN